MSVPEKSVEEEIQDKRTFQTISTGAVYKLPKYKILPGVGLVKAWENILIPFVRGSKIEGEREIMPVEGIVHESLLSMQIYDLELKNKEVPNELTPQVIKHLEAARDLLESRQRERSSRNVLGTYQK